MRVSLKRPERPPGYTHLHHVFNGNPQRKYSEKYNAVIYLHPSVHEMVHADAAVRRELKAEYQARLEDAGWTREEFIETFGRSWRD